MKRVLFLLSFIITLSVALNSPNHWFVDLFEVDDYNQNGLARHNTTHQKLCCERIVFQEDLYGDAVGNINIPFDYWWKSGGVRLSVSHDLESPASGSVTIGLQGIEIDGMVHSEAYLRVQCAYDCCFEGLGFVRAYHAQNERPMIFAATMGNSTRHEARLIKAHPSLAPVLVPETMGIPTEHLFVGGDDDDDDGSEESRYERLVVCDRTGEGMYLHFIMPMRAMYAISELDICFIDHDLAREWLTGLCSEL